MGWYIRSTDMEFFQPPSDAFNFILSILNVKNKNLYKPNLQKRACLPNLRMIGTPTSFELRDNYYWTTVGPKGKA